MCSRFVDGVLYVKMTANRLWLLIIKALLALRLDQWLNAISVLQRSGLPLAPDN
ncbi:hypothetical protein [Methylomonas albis]|uniref:Transposase n=1 Tax=Methylomonas albis TaxID=1854563 RepID=A0ABR9D1N2_9GAMM|nr:hypothetical protein [Methylomonas albis]MBD9356940.1 hypothetical protein [Methylomonas albis]